MKTLNEYLALPYRMEIVEDREEGGYVVSYPVSYTHLTLPTKA